VRKEDGGITMINDSMNRFLGVLCYPLLSMELFWEDLLDRYIDAVKQQEDCPKKAEKLREQLKSNVIGYIRKNYTIYSYDEIYLYLEKCYLYDAEDYEHAPQMYWTIMTKIATSLISHRDGRIVFKYWENKEDRDLFGGFAGNNKVDLFHSLNCHIPMDVFAIIYMIINQEKPDSRCLDYFYGNIDVADKQLSRILEKGVAENHLHKGVSRTFSSTWDSMMEPLTAQKGRIFYNRQLVSGTKEQNRKMIFYILGCGIVRGWLIYKMAYESLAEEKEPGGYRAGENGIREIEVLVERFRDGRAFEDWYRECDQKEPEEEMIAHYTQLWTILERLFPEGAYENRLCTFVMGEAPTLHTFDENVFLYHVLGRMYREEMSVRWKRCVIQYLRVRNYLFHISVQQKTIKGLDYFQQVHYGVNSELNRINLNNFWKSAIREQLQNQNLHKIEFRFSMPAKESDFRKEVLGFLKAYRNILLEDYCYADGGNHVPCQKLPQVGLVIHFLKRQDAPVPKKCFRRGETNCAYYRFGELQKYYESQIDAFVRLRSEFGELSRYLVGIDAASLENSTPVWVFAPIYNRARDSMVEPIGRCGSHGEFLQSLGFTFHAGEDFRHILSGLRRIDEAVEYLKFHAGDRIGHGIALGISPREWKSQNPVVILPQMEALENYLWAYDTLSKNYSDFQASVLAYMEQRILELAGNIYNGAKGITLEMLISSYRRMFSDGGIQRELGRDMDWLKENLCGQLDAMDKISWDARLLAAARHCNIYAKRMERPVHYEVREQDILIIEELQKILREKLGKKGIVIEVNPSSNTAIADLDVCGENQLYQMNDINDKKNVIVCINSDDPAVFNTNVSNELAYIYYGMLERNVSREAALLWIDRIRENGMDNSFIRHTESDEVLLNKLCDLINDL